VNYCGQLLCINWYTKGFTARGVVFLFTNIVAIQMRTTPAVCTAYSPIQDIYL